MSYLKKRRGTFLFCLFVALSYNLYFLFLLPEVRVEYLIYLNVLLAFAGLIFGGNDYFHFRYEKNRIRELLSVQTLIYQEFPRMEQFEAVEHDIRILQGQIKEQFDANCDLEDYIAKWHHELKIPLAAALLMNEKIEDEKLRTAMQEQLERMNQQLKSILLGCKIQSSLFDIQIRQTDLLDCVKASLHNNQYFLIRNHFEIRLDVEDVCVYTDKNWLVYMLDQLIGNAIKYAGEEPVLKIRSRQTKETAILFVEDNGEGIKDSDIRRIFEKGYTGSSYHNGKYKSTGMGLYMVAKIAEKTGHKISVESEWGKYTRFQIEMNLKQ